MIERIEWPTLGLAVLCYAAFGFSTVALPEVSVALAIAATGVAIALHASLTHEIIHGHPFPGRPGFGAALAWPPLTLAVPFLRFRDTHLAHHNDAVLTDPYDDPESNYLAPDVWARLPRWVQAILNMNNTLLGRIILGPAIGTFVFLRTDLSLIRAGDGAALRGWLWHVPGLAVVLAWVGWCSGMPFWAYACAAYLAMALLRIRTFLEHQAHDRASGRTAIVEGRGPLAWLFLNNNLHVVHHMHPKVPWYRLPALYAAHRDHYRRRNGGYVFASYTEVFRNYLLRRKDPVPHPLRDH